MLRRPTGVVPAIKRKLDLLFLQIAKVNYPELHYKISNTLSWRPRFLNSQQTKKIATVFTSTEQKYRFLSLSIGYLDFYVPSVYVYI